MLDADQILVEIYRWEFDEGKQSLTVAVNGPLIVDDVDLGIRAALDRVGLAYLGEDRTAPRLDPGALVRVLEQWCQPCPGFYFYYPSRRQQPGALSAVIAALRLGNPLSDRARSIGLTQFSFSTRYACQ
jgi:DNA-binding transcriptional LysR family regulator